MLACRLSAILNRGSGLLSLLFIFLTFEQVEQAINVEVNESPRDLLLILSEIERELGENITDPDLIQALEHGGIVEGAKRTWEHIKERYWKIHKKVIPSDYLSNGTSGNITAELVDDHKVEIHLEDELSDPIQPPYEVPDPPGSVNPHNYQWIFNPSRRCKRDQTRFLVLIKSKEENYQVRHTIRDTWCTSTNGTTCMFLVGRDYTLEKNKIKVEADHFKDILMEEFSDDDQIRKVIMGLKWAFKYCQEARYILKVNDNVWANIERFQEYFDSNSISDNFFGGKCIMSEPDRNPKSEKYLSEEAYPASRLPVTCSDTGYLFTSDMIKKFYDASLNLPPLVRYDDIYFGLLANQLQFMPRSTNGFNYGKFVLQRACEYKANAFTLLLGGKSPKAIQSTVQSLHDRLAKC